MSRYYLKIEHYPLAEDYRVSAEFHYGFDRRVGYFYQVYLPRHNTPLEEKGAWRRELTGAQLLAHIDALNAPVPQHHRNAIARDQPF